MFENVLWLLRCFPVDLGVSARLPGGRRCSEPGTSHHQLVFSAWTAAWHRLSLPKGLTCIMSHLDIVMEQAPKMERSTNQICLSIKSSLSLKFDPTKNLLH